MKNSRNCVRVLMLAIALLGAARAAQAQFDTATVVGTIKDASGAAVPSAKVTLTNLENGIADVRTSNGDGNFEFVSVRAGVYLCRARKKGFRLR